MPGAKRLTAFDRVQLPAWEYLGGETFTDPSDQALNIPSEASIIEIEAEDAECYYAINSATASANSPGYVPAEGGRIIGPLSNLVSLAVTGAAGSIVHVMYFKEV